jgi:peptide/nickel transport system ATP-binding protein/oligopeptide transport system ATP-binding protein
MMPLLDIKDLIIGIKKKHESIPIVKGISFSAAQGEITGIVGESGCGKSLTALSIMRLIKPPVSILGGSIEYNGTNLLALGKKEMYAIRGKEISMIFQEPMTSLHPLKKIGEQIGETIREHNAIGKKEERERIVSLLTRVGINSPERRMNQLPHELSGGMRQRVMIAIALSCESKFLIADEPTTALDVTIQAQILDLIKSLTIEQQLGVLLITHDLGVVSETCKKVIVLYAGEIVEMGNASELLAKPKHPYMEALLQAIPSSTRRTDQLFSIPGRVPAIDEIGTGCPFAPRCHRKMDACVRIHPELVQIGSHSVRCLLHAKGIEE